MYLSNGCSFICLHVCLFFSQSLSLSLSLSLTFLSTFLYYFPTHCPSTPLFLHTFIHQSFSPLASLNHKHAFCRVRICNVISYLDFIDAVIAHMWRVTQQSRHPHDLWRLDQLRVARVRYADVIQLRRDHFYQSVPRHTALIPRLRAVLWQHQ